MSEAPASFDPLVDEVPSRYVIGIDLGTTNSAVTYIDTSEQPWQIRVLAIPQLVAPGAVESLDTLPSFHYQPPEGQGSGKVLRLPWAEDDMDHCVGVMARDDGSKVAGRGISSAKSWLCHPGVDRSAALLPWHGADDVERLSPVEVSSRYLAHIRAAWNHQFKNEPLEDQDIIITLPASFDEVARELTVQAAKQAGMSRVVLIEEPQAAFYAWVYKHQEDWQNKVNVGQKILVCDIGGGTTDFTLIRVRSGGADEESIQFHRVAVGDHLILGGDNLDLALAKHLEVKLAGGKQLPPRQWDLLIGSSRNAKEQLLGEAPPEKVTISVGGGGSKLIAGSQKTELTGDELREFLLEGFLPVVSVTDKPTQHASGFQEFGLPYASDAAISRYLCQFLTTHCYDGISKAERLAHGDQDYKEACPDIVLFNGGFFASPVLRERVLSLFEQWFEKKPIVLDNDRLDLAVARGASYYGMVRRGTGVKIAASLARSYYIGVESSQTGVDSQAVCLVPGSALAGEEFELEQVFRLTISEPVEFSLLVSSTRLADQPGQLLPINSEEMKSLPPIRTVLRSKNRSEKGEVDVRLRVRMTEIGTIDLSCHEVESNRSWKLQFDIRSATQTDRSGHEAIGESQGVIDEDTWQVCSQHIADVFGEEGTAKHARLIKLLSSEIGSGRDVWPMSLLRRIWESLVEYESGRRKSLAHEARWLNLLGYTLRPGYGLAVDDWRVAETWRSVYGRLVHSGGNLQAEMLILWRRIAGGLTRGQQVALADAWLPAIRALRRRLTSGGTSGSATLKPEESVEVWRLIGSLELLGTMQKREVGDIIVDLIDHKKMQPAQDAMIWAIGRLGSRVPMYGPLNGVISSDHASRWINKLQNQEANPLQQLAIVQLARKTHDRYRDLSEADRADIVDYLTANEVSEHQIQLVKEGGEMNEEEQGQVFGETLPRGLRLV